MYTAAVANVTNCLKEMSETKELIARAMFRCMMEATTALGNWPLQVVTRETTPSPVQPSGLQDPSCLWNLHPAWCRLMASLNWFSTWVRFPFCCESKKNTCLSMDFPVELGHFLRGKLAVMQSAEFQQDSSVQNHHHTPNDTGPSELLVIALTHIFRSCLLYTFTCSSCHKSFQVNTSLLSHVKSNQNAHGMRNGVEDNQTYIHVNKFVHVYHHKQYIRNKSVRLAACAWTEVTLHKVCNNMDKVKKTKTSAITLIWKLQSCRLLFQESVHLQLHISVYGCKCVLCNKEFTFAVALKKLKRVLQASVTSGRFLSSPTSMLSLPSSPLSIYFCLPIFHALPFHNYSQRATSGHTNPTYILLSCSPYPVLCCHWCLYILFFFSPKLHSALW